MTKNSNCFTSLINILSTAKSVKTFVHVFSWMIFGQFIQIKQTTDFMYIYFLKTSISIENTYLQRHHRYFSVLWAHGHASTYT